MVDEIKRALEIAETIPFRYLIQHLGVAAEEFDERQGGCGVLIARRAERVRPAARRGDPAGEHLRTSFSSAERLLTVSSR